MLLKRSFGPWLVGIGLLLPVVTYYAGYLYVARLAGLGGPPDQGAMVMAYLGFMASVGVGVCLAAVGMVVSLMGLRRTASHG